MNNNSHAALNSNTPELKWIPTKDLHIDPEYQRTCICQPRVAAIARDWRWDLCGAISVKIRDGVNFVVDGQHRVEGASRAGVPKLPCVITSSEGQSDEARTLVRLNTDRSAVAAVDRFRAMVTAGDQIYLDVQRMLSYFNLHITKSANGNSAVAFPALLVTTFKRSPRLCERAIYLQTKILGDSKQPLAQEIHRGLFWILRNTDTANREILEAAIPRVFANGGKAAVLHAIRARALATAGKNHHDRVCALGCLDVLNKGLHKRIQLNGDGE